MRGGSLNPTLVEAMDLKVDRGAYLAEILENAPAAKARLAGADEQITVNGRLIAVGGDVITEIDGQPVRSFDDLLIYVALNTQPGQTVTLTILRDGEFEQFDVTLERRQADMSTFENP